MSGASQTKQMRMLRMFAQGRALHRFQAELIGDHCPHSTVSGLQRRFGIAFARKWVKVPTLFGRDTSVMLYWLNGESLARANRLLSEQKEGKRDAA